VPTRGKYIVIEGSDGTGKTTQLSEVEKWLAAEGHEVVVVSEPADPVDEAEPLEIAKHLRRLVKDGTVERLPETNLHLFAAARIEKWFGEIEPALKQGKYVLSSRNYWSTLAYQGYGEGLSIDYITTMTRLDLGDTGYMQPDAAVILSLTDEGERAARVAKRGLHEKHDTFETKPNDFQYRVAEGYLTIAHDYSIPVVDAGGTVGEVAERVTKELGRQLAA